MIYKELNLENLFDFCSVLDKIGIEEFKGAFNGLTTQQSIQNGESDTEVGVSVVFDMVGILCKNMPKCKDEICRFTANCIMHDDETPYTAGQVRKMSIAEFFKTLQGIFTQPDIADFFKQAAKWLGMGKKNS